MQGKLYLTIITEKSVWIENKYYENKVLLNPLWIQLPAMGLEFQERVANVRGIKDILAPNWDFLIGVSKRIEREVKRE